MDEIARAYATLSSLKQNVPNTFEVEQSWVNDFHSVLDKIEKATSLDLQEFRVPQQELHKEISGGNSISGEVDYSGRTVVERMRLLMKLDAVLGYFTTKTTMRSIGFNKG